jgi:hypothetical protein
MSVYAADAVSGRQSAFWSLLGLKVAFVLLLLLPAINSDWPQYDDKGMHWRMLAFPLVALVMPALWWVAGGRPPYPYLADALVVLVPLMDVLWNTFDAYDHVWWWDDLTHLLNSVLIASVIGLWLRRYPVGPVVRIFLVVGLGMTLAVAWELAEYPTFLSDSPELVTAYRDTLGDLGVAMLGSTFAATLAARPAERATNANHAEPVPALSPR